MTLQRQIASARVAQIARVNESPERLLERIAELQAEVDRLRAVVKQLSQPLPTDERMYHGRPVLTLSEAATRAGVKYWTAARYVNERHWEAVQLEDRSWMVYADQALTLRGRKNGRKKRSC